jgi:two-component system response regulator AlgR
VKVPEPRPPRTLVVVDDQPDFLDLARSRLARHPGLRVVGEATSGEAALQLMPQLEPSPEAVLVDVEMPGLDGFETARRLRDLAPGVRIILTSASDNRAYSRAASELGAAFLAKRSLSVEAILHLID